MIKKVNQKTHEQELIKDICALMRPEHDSFRGLGSDLSFMTYLLGSGTRLSDDCACFLDRDFVTIKRLALTSDRQLNDAVRIARCYWLDQAAYCETRDVQHGEMLKLAECWRKLGIKWGGT